MSSDGDAVYQVSDKKNNHNLLQATESDRPLYKTGIQNGLSVIRFDGTNDIIATAAGIVIGSAARTLFVVAQTAGTGSAAHIVSEGNTSASGSLYVLTTEIAVRVNDGSRVFDTAFGTTNFAILTVQNPTSGNADNISAWLDGVPLGITSTVTRGLAIPDVGYRIADDTTGDFTAMDFGESVYCDAVLSTADMNSLGSYLGTKWNISWTTIT